jgi:hypothetical protein
MIALHHAPSAWQVSKWANPRPPGRRARPTSRLRLPLSPQAATILILAASSFAVVNGAINDARSLLPADGWLHG